MPIRAKRKSQRPDDYLNGVPNRDLDESEYQDLTTEQRALVRSSGLYDVKTDLEMRPPKRDEFVVPSGRMGGGDS